MTTTTPRFGHHPALVEALWRARYPQATRLMITADAGGSNSSRSRLWKLELARLVAFIAR